MIFHKNFCDFARYLTILGNPRFSPGAPGSPFLFSRGPRTPDPEKLSRGNHPGETPEIKPPKMAYEAPPAPGGTTLVEIESKLIWL